MRNLESNAAVSSSATSSQARTRRRRYRTALLIAAMLGSILTVALLVFGDVKRRSAESLGDFAKEQATLAQCLSQNLHDKLMAQEPSAQLDRLALLSSLHAFEQKGERLVLLKLPPAAPGTFLTTDGKKVLSPLLDRALSEGSTVIQVPRDEAFRMGLPERLAIAGLAPIDAQDRKKGSVAAVSTALRERDREQQASWRTLLGVLIAAGAVLSLGGVALHWQRQELRMQRALEIEDARRLRDERLEQASRAAALGTLAMGITHELSTPLGIIAARAEQLGGRVAKDERAARSVRVITEQSERMSQIIRGMLGLVRGQNPAAEPLWPDAIASAAISLVEHRFIKSGIPLSLDAPEVLPRVLGDPRLLEHALVNLLLNARDACEKKMGSHVELRVRIEDGVVVFSVVDDGAGISEADAERATEPFFTTKPVGQGSGLGLAIAHEIVKSHRGNFHIAPGKDGGTCAAITLPLLSEETYAPASLPAHSRG